MRVYKNLEAYKPDPKHPLFLGLGNFDGIHLGHQVLIQKGLEEANEKNGIASVFTFQEHPQSVLRPHQRPQLLTSLDHKVLLLQQHGLKTCFLIPFTKTFSEIEAEDFVNDVLIKKLQVHQVRMGYSGRFGHHRKGDAELMQRLAEEHGFLFQKVDPIRAEGAVVSSSRIRKLVLEGELEMAEKCLGRRFSVLGEVTHGDERGAGLGFPTANLEIAGEVMPPEAVYAVRVREIQTTRKAVDEGVEDWEFQTSKDWQPGVLNYGRRPTFPGGTKAPLIEVHILDFEADLYGKHIEVEFCGRLRPEKAFEGVEELKAQIQADIRRARELFKNPAF